MKDSELISEAYALLWRGHFEAAEEYFERYLATRVRVVSVEPLREAWRGDVAARRLSAEREQAERARDEEKRRREAEEERREEAEEVKFSRPTPRNTRVRRSEIDRWVTRNDQEKSSGRGASGGRVAAPDSTNSKGDS